MAGHEAEIRIGHAAFRQGVAARRGIGSRQRSMQGRMAAERGGEALDLGVVQRIADDQVAIP